jgi:hypothetical protein
MNDDIVEELLRNQQALEGERMVWEGHWRQVLRRVLPRQDDIGQQRAQGAARTEYIFDSTAPLALDRFSAAMEGMLAPRSETWHTLTTNNKELNRLPRVRRYFEEATSILFHHRYAPHANFASQFHETMMSLGAIGTGAFMIDEIKGKGLGYKSIHMGEIFVAEDQHGRIDTVHRKFEFTHRQAAQKWGADKLPEKIKKRLNSHPFEKSTYLHVIRPRVDRDVDRLDYRGMAIASYYLSCEGKQLMSEGGFHTMPVPVSRYLTAPRETYGRSPGMQALPDIKMVNEMAKTVLRAVHKAVDPPLLMSDDGVLGRYQNKPGGLNVGGLDSRGNPLVREMTSNARLDWAIQVLEKSRSTINDAFLVTLFQILVDSPDRMTATEVLERMREKGVLLAPAMGRQETELLGPCIERELDILGRAGYLPDMPGELVEAGGEYQPMYDNPLSRAQRANQATGFTNWVSAVTPIAQVPGGEKIFQMVDIGKAARGLADVLGVPIGWMKDEDQVAAEDADAAQQQQLAQLVDAIPAAAKASADFARADQMAGAAVA